jgi:hypothetical protein
VGEIVGIPIVFVIRLFDNPNLQVGGPWGERRVRGRKSDVFVDRRQDVIVTREA